MTLSMSKLVGDQFLVSGTDINGQSGSAVLDGSQWADLNRHKAQHEADANFQEAVDSFFAPLLEAGEKAGKALVNVPDPLTYVVLHEGQEGSPERSEQRVLLSHDSQVIRLMQEGRGHNRLVWVNDTLAILEAPAAPVAPSVPTAADVTAVGEENLRADG